jgi:hypothetical protein
VAKRHSAISTKPRRRPATRTYSEHVISLLSRRDDLMTEMAIMRSRARAPRSFITKAGTLLTRHWANANWQTREEILRAAHWLLNVGKIQPLAAPPRVRKNG